MPLVKSPKLIFTHILCDETLVPGLGRRQNLVFVVRQKNSSEAIRWLLASTTGVPPRTRAGTETPAQQKLEHMLWETP